MGIKGENTGMDHTDYLKEQASDIRRRYKGPLNEECFSERIYEESNRNRADGPFQRDYSRIMYASSFRRLQGKMQLLGIKNDQFFRNRLTHSLEVAQIARSIAYEIEYEKTESFVVEAGALAHDIGNPPFGHSGEKKLNELFQDIGGFEGNAQTLRILSRIEKKKAAFPGLNLTYRTLLSVVKYFKKREDGENQNSKFIYDDDYEMLDKFISKNEVKVRTLDVQVVDIADIIAYAAHDLEDGLRQKCFTIDEILLDFKNKFGGENNSYKKLKEIVEELQNADYGKIDSSEYSKLFRQELASKIIYILIHDICLKEVSLKSKQKTGSMWDKELGFKEYEDLAEGLKEITFKCINHNDEVYQYEQKGNMVLEYLAGKYEKEPKLLPPEYRVEYVIASYEKSEKKPVEDKSEEYQKKLQKRLICDYIAGMMDSFAITTYEKLSGKKL